MCHAATVWLFKPDAYVAWKSCGYFVLHRAQIQLVLYFKSRGAACFIYRSRAISVECHLMLNSIRSGVFLFICSIWLKCNWQYMRYAYVPMQMNKYFLTSVGFQLHSRGMIHFLLWSSCYWLWGCGTCKYWPSRWSCSGRSWATGLSSGCAEWVLIHWSFDPHPFWRFWTILCVVMNS